MKPLPFIDRHCVVTDSSLANTWNGLVRVLASRLRGGGWIARGLGCEPTKGTVRFRGRRGEAVPGFRVHVSEPGRSLVLRGRHRFAHYRLSFLLDGERLCAETYAEFPGLKGRIYRAAVIGSGGHKWVVRWVLRKVALASREVRHDRAPGLPLSEATRQRVERMFSPEDLAEATRLLETECDDRLAGVSTASLERVRIAAIRVSRGSVPGLLQAIDLGQTDFRDLLMAAGFGRDVEAHLYWWPRDDE